MLTIFWVTKLISKHLIFEAVSFLNCELVIQNRCKAQKQYRRS